ncbi:MAG: sulfatase, partial [Planctomycetota bacterium]
MNADLLRTLACRRRFLQGASSTLGALALRSVLGGGDDQRPPLVARAKNVIWLHREGAPPTLDMFDRKPTLDRLHLQKCPD